MNLGENIRKMRKDKKITMKQLGDMVGISEQGIGNYERGDRKPSIEVLTKIAEALETTLSELISGREFGDGVADSFASVTQGMSKEDINLLHRKLLAEGDLILCNNKQEILTKESDLELLKIIKIIFSIKLSAPYRGIEFIDHEIHEVFDNTLSMIDNKVKKIETNWEKYIGLEINDIKNKDK